MPIEIKILNSKDSQVVVRVRRPAWQEFIHY